MTDKYANIMLLGRTGVGKSSFINYLVGKDVCKVGTGMPITQGFNTYRYNNVSGLPLQIFDSKGLEVMDYSTIKREIIDFVKQRCGSEDVHNWIHSIFYCINVEGRRLEPEEVLFIKSLSGEITQTVHIIMTHCKQSEEGLKISSKMEQFIKSQLDNRNIRIYCVNSTVTNTRVGTFGTFGRKEILNQIFELLWADISYKISNEYANELYKGVTEICDEISDNLNRLSQKFNTLETLMESQYFLQVFMESEYFKKLEKKINSAETRCEKIEQELNKKYQNKIKPFVEFCNEYGSSMGKEIELYNPLDFINDSKIVKYVRNEEIDMDSITKKTKFFKYIDELDNIEGDNIWEILHGIGTSIVVLFSFKKGVKEFCNVLSTELYKSIPTKNEIQESMYSAFMKGYHN